MDHFHIPGISPDVDPPRSEPISKEELDMHLSLRGQLLDEAKHELEQARHQFEKDKYALERRHEQQLLPGKHTADFVSRRMSLSYAAMDLYRYGMGHDYKPHTVEAMLDEYTTCWNKLYALTFPDGLTAVKRPVEEPVHDRSE